MPLHALQALGATIKGQVDALRLQATIRHKRFARPERAIASPAEIADLVERQLGPWRDGRIDRGSLHERLHHLNETSFRAFVFDIRAGRVSVRDKRPFAFPPDVRAARHAQMRQFAVRRSLYRIFLQAVVSRYAFDADIALAIDPSDIAAPADVPLFGFQKPSGSQIILLPDVDFFHWHWYVQPQDDRRYEDKAIRACFVGSSTGGRVTEQAIAGLTLPRLRSAAHFAGSATVDFRIAQAVQTDGEAATRLLERQPYFSKPVLWRDQFGHRFLISMDGNGATFSRLVIALKSHSALLKYRSDFNLYYFPALVAGRDYIDIATDRDVEQAVELEQREPGHFKPVAEAGRAFAARYLNRTSVSDYTAALLRGYAAIYNA